MPTKTAKRGREAADGRLKPGEYRHSQQTGKDPARVRLAERVERCVKASEAMGREVFRGGSTARPGCATRRTWSAPAASGGTGSR